MCVLHRIWCEAPLRICVKNAPIINRFEIQRAEKASIFFFEIRKLRFIQLSQCFFMFTHVNYSFSIFEWLCFASAAVPIF